MAASAPAWSVTRIGETFSRARKSMASRSARGAEIRVEPVNRQRRPQFIRQITGDLDVRRRLSGTPRLACLRH